MAGSFGCDVVIVVTVARRSGEQKGRAADIGQGTRSRVDDIAIKSGSGPSSATAVGGVQKGSRRMYSEFPEATFRTGKGGARHGSERTTAAVETAGGNACCTACGIEK